MEDKLYTYAVSRIRSKELTLLGNSDIDRLLTCKAYKDCMQTLFDKGWGKDGNETAENLLKTEREKIWDLMRELVENMSVFDIFLYEYDFHNLKAAIKQVYKNEDTPNIYISDGTVSPEIIYQAVKEHDFSYLPGHLQACAEEAYEIQMHAGDSQLCDVILDKAALEMLYKQGKSSGNDLLSGYSEIRVASADIKIALRGQKMKKGREFLERAMAACDSIDIQKLIQCSLEGKAEIYQYLEVTEYSDAVPAIKESDSAFEKWCDNRIIDYIKPQKYNSFTISPLAAYILARENEIKTVRILLIGKRNDLPDNSIRERMRDMYV